MAEVLPNNGRPDPSPVTAARILSEVSSLEAVVDSKFETMVARIQGIEKSYDVFRSDLTRVPTDVDRAVGNLKELLTMTRDERFRTVDEQLRAISIQFDGIRLQFRERDTRTEQNERKNETALTNALNAAKEAGSQQYIAFGQATSKSESGFIKQIDQLINSFQSSIKSLDEKIGAGNKTSDDKIANLEKQLTLLIGTGVGQSAQQKTHDTGNTLFVAIGAVLVALIIGGSMVAINLMK